MTLDRRSQRATGRPRNTPSPAKGVAGKRTLTERIAPRPASVTQKTTREGASGAGERASTDAAVHAHAERGIGTPASALPYAGSIQRLFGRHDISSIQAHIGPDADAAARGMGARAYATGDHVVLGAGADQFTVAHEAAHVVQQRGGVQLQGGVGEAGDRYEQHANEVAALVVNGQSAEAVLDRHAGGAPAAAAVQRDDWGGALDSVLEMCGFGSGESGDSGGASAAAPDAAGTPAWPAATADPDSATSDQPWCPAPAADASDANQCGPDGDNATSPGHDGGMSEPASAKKPETEGEASETEFSMAFPKIGPFGLELAVSSKGEASMSGMWELKELEEIDAPICPGVYIKAQPELSGGFALKGNPKEKTCSATGTLGASFAVSLRGGLPHLASVGGGCGVKGTVSLTGSWSASAGWALGPLTITLSGEPFVSGEIGEMEYKTTFDSLEIFVVTIGAGGVDFKLGPDVARRLFGFDSESYQQQQLRQYHDQLGGEGSTGAPPPDADGGAGGAGGF
jgi:hypothetical protein